MSKFNLFVSKFDSLSAADQIKVYNKFCKFNLNGGTIYKMRELDELFTGVSPTKLISMTSEGFSINDNYFIITSFGLESFNDAREVIRDFTYDIYKCREAWKEYIK